MSKVAINSVTNANVYMDGTNFMGRAAEVTLPKLTRKTIEHQGLGLMGVVEIPAGGYDKMEAKIKWASVYPEVQRKVYGGKGVQIQVRASMESYTGQGRTAEVAIVITLGGVFKENDLGTLKRHESSQPEDTMTVYYMKQVIDGETIREVDFMNNIDKVADEDLLARFRSIIGG